MTVYQDHEKAAFKHLVKDAVCYSWQDELCPKTGRKHLQGYVGFDKQIWFTTLKRRLPTAHIEVALDPARAYEYCRKEETRDPAGESDCSGRGPDHKVASSWDAAYRYFLGGGSYADSRGLFPKLYATQDSGLRKLFELALEHRERGGPDDGLVGGDVDVGDGLGKRGRRSISRCVIIWGPPGTGKSSSVEQLINGREHFRMANGKWFDGYAYERILWMDDFHPGQVNRAMLLQLMESGHFRAEVKGGMTLVHIDELYITSNWDPLTWFPEEDKELMKERGFAVVRRAEVIHVQPAGGLEITPVGNTVSTGVVKEVSKKITDHFKPKPGTVKERERDREERQSSPDWVDEDSDTEIQD